MKITAKRAQTIIMRYEELVSSAQRFLQEIGKSRWSYPTIRFSDGNIEHYINTACHCHPEMSWETAATMEEFGAWLEKQNQS